MAKSKTILYLKSNPSGPPEHGPIDAYTWRIMKGDDGYKISINQAGDDGTRRRKFFGLKEKTAVRWLDRLSAVRISLMPHISDSCDGSYYTFKFQSDAVGIELYWHNTPPEGAETLDKFVDLLWKLVPDSWDKNRPMPFFSSEHEEIAETGPVRNETAA
jgi:hypothetical protein